MLFRPSVLACLLLLAAASQVQGGPALEASALQATGDASADAALTLLLREGAVPVAADFVLEAQALTVEVDRATAVEPDPGAHQSLNPVTDTNDYGQSSVTALRVRDLHEWLLLSMEGREAPTISLNGNCIHAEANDEEVQRAPLVDASRGMVVIDARNSVRASTCSEMSIEVAGDFLLILWEWDVQIQSEGQTLDVGSGRSPTGVAGDAVQERRQIFMYADDAVLRAPLDADALLYLGETKMEVHGSILLREASGVVASEGDSIALDDDSVVMTGEMVAFATRTESALKVDLSGEIREVHANGQTVVHDPDASNRLAMGWFWLAASLVGLLIAAALIRQVGAYRAYQKARGHGDWHTVPRTLRERIGMGWHVRARRAVARGDFEAARRFMRRAVFWAGHVPDHTRFRARSMGSLAMVEATLRDHEALDILLKDARERAENALAAAELCRAVGDHGRADRWMDTARKADPDLQRRTPRIDDRSSPGPDVA